MRPKHKTALVTVGQGYGNIVMATPLMAAAGAMDYAVDVLVESHHADAATLLSGWDALNAIYLNRATLRHARAYHPYDAVVRTVWNRGAPLGLGPEVSPDDLSLAAHHETDVNMTAARRLGFSGKEIPSAHVETELPFWPLPDRFMAVAPGYGGAARGDWARKAWPHWPEFVERLHAESKGKILILGTGDDEAPWMTDEDKTWLHNLCGRTSIRGAAGVLSRCEGVVALDNGLAHVAAALGRPTTVLFGPTSEIKNAPRGRDVTVVAPDLPCRPCQMTDRWNACADWRCMAAIAPGDVLASMRLQEGKIPCGT